MPVDRMLRRALLACLLALLPPAAGAVPPIEHWTTARGARVYFIAAHELPMVDVRIVFDAGSARDGERPGLAALTSHMLLQGAGGLDADAIADRIDAVGARLDTSAGRDTAVLSLRSLRAPRWLDPAVEVLHTVLTRPDFPAADLERERERVLVGLRQRAQSPGDLADDAFHEALYGDHPYAHRVSGTEESVKDLGRDALIAFHRRYYVARNAVVAVVGDLDRAAATALVEGILEGLPAGQVPPPLPEVQPPAAARTVHVPFPSTQAHLLVGEPVLTRGDPDYFTLYVANHVLGGSGLVSRLAEDIRERRGLAYSVYSYFNPMARPGPFEAGLQTRADQAREALGLLRGHIRRWVQEGVSEEELARSRANITGGFPLRIDSNGKLVSYLATIGFYRLPLDYLDTFTARIEAVTREDIADALRRRVHPRRMVTVVVGPEAP